MRKHPKVLAKGPKKTHPFFERILTIANVSEHTEELKNCKLISLVEEEADQLGSQVICGQTVDLIASEQCTDAIEHSFELELQSKSSQNSLKSKNKQCTNPPDQQASAEKKINAFSLLLQKRSKSSTNSQCTLLSPIADLAFYGNWQCIQAPQSANQCIKPKKLNSTASDTPLPSVAGFKVNLKATQPESSWKDLVPDWTIPHPPSANSSKLTQWLTLYKIRRNQPSYDSEGEELFSLAQEEDFVRNSALLLCTPNDSSLGREMIKSAAAEIGFSILEIDCSCKRDGESLIRTVQEGTKSKRNVFCSVDSSGCSDSLIVIQQIESVFPADQGFFSALSSIANSSKRPMIFTSALQPHYWDWTFLKNAECLVLEHCSLDNTIPLESSYSFLLSGFNELVYEAFQVQCSLELLQERAAANSINEFEPENEAVFPRKIFLPSLQRGNHWELCLESFSLPFSFDCNLPASKKASLEQGLSRFIVNYSSLRQRKSANKLIN